MLHLLVGVVFAGICITLFGLLLAALVVGLIGSLFRVFLSILASPFRQNNTKDTG